MNKNVGDVDRMARAVVGFALLWVPLVLTIPKGTEYYVLSAAAVVLGASAILSAIKGYCFVYGVLGISSCRS